MKVNMDLGYTKLILEECRKYGCLRNQAAYILATAYWETARTMKPVVEAFWKNEAWRKRNLRYWPWHGRGFVQLTWERNYRLASKKIGVDFIKKPDAVMEPENSAKILVVGSMEGWFTGRSIPNYITLSKSNFKSARRVINGTDKAQAIANIAKAYDEELKRIGYGEEPEAPKDFVVEKEPEVTPEPEATKGNLVTVLVKILSTILSKVFSK